VKRVAAGAVGVVRDSNPWRALGDAREALAIQEFPSFLLSRVGNLAKLRLTGIYLERAGLRLPEWRLLTILAHFSPTTYGTLVRRSTMDKGQISLTLRTLIARQWASWAEADEGKANTARGRPARIIAITPQGRAMIRKILPDARRIQTELLAQFTADERARLYVLLRKTLAVLEAFGGEEKH
jgi:DNA-binding MarR family transcriptional regulator